MARKISTNRHKEMQFQQSLQDSAETASPYVCFVEILCLFKYEVETKQTKISRSILWIDLYITGHLEVEKNKTKKKNTYYGRII